MVVARFMSHSMGTGCINAFVFTGVLALIFASSTQTRQPRVQASGSQGPDLMPNPGLSLMRISLGCGQDHCERVHELKKCQRGKLKRQAKVKLLRS